MVRRRPRALADEDEISRSRLDPTEVVGTFEAPLRHLLDPATHSPRKRRIANEEIETIDLPWGSFNIWGATAGMLLTLGDVLGETAAHGH